LEHRITIEKNLSVNKKFLIILIKEDLRVEIIDKNKNKDLDQVHIHDPNQDQEVGKEWVINLKINVEYL